LRASGSADPKGPAGNNVAPFERVHLLVTDRLPPEDIGPALEKAGVELPISPR
jgi:hypothetical protein